MASSSKFLSLLLLFFFISSSSSPQTHARESQHFSKFPKEPQGTNDHPHDTTTTTITTTKPQQDVPTFTTGEENHNGYGLYGSSNTNQESRFMTYPDDSKTTSGDQEYNGGGQNSEYMFNNGVPYNTNNNGGGDTRQQYVSSDTSYQQENVNTNNYNNYGSETRQGVSTNEMRQKSLYGHYKNQFPVQQQGMSDTRYLENGKYFYDLNKEQMYQNQNQNQYQTARRKNDVYRAPGYRGVNPRYQNNQQGVVVDDNLYRFNNYMDNNQENNNNNQGEYVP